MTGIHPSLRSKAALKMEDKRGYFSFIAPVTHPRTPNKNNRPFHVFKRGELQMEIRNESNSSVSRAFVFVAKKKKNR